jgi:hypothetical protein
MNLKDLSCMWCRSYDGHSFLGEKTDDIGCSENIYPNGLPLPWETPNPTGEQPQEIDE